MQGKPAHWTKKTLLVDSKRSKKQQSDDVQQNLERKRQLDTHNHKKTAKRCFLHTVIIKR